MQTSTSEGGESGIDEHEERPRFWTSELMTKAAMATTFSELTDVALKVQLNMRECLAAEDRPHEIAQVCGPISTGGLFNRERNLVRILSAIATLKRGGGMLVFNQIVFEEHFRRVEEIHGKGIKDVLLPTFYQPLFYAGHVNRLYMLPDWQRSRRASWEHRMAKNLGIEVVYLPHP